jgi:hypothetical protein
MTTRPPAAPVGRATLPPMSLDELRAAAERVLSILPSDDLDRDALALAAWVRDLLGQQTTRCAKYIGKHEVPQTIHVSGWGYFSPDAVRAIAADLLRAAESAGSLPEARVHEREEG